MKKIDWIIHYCTNGICDECGYKETRFIDYACNAHTHGMEKYGHMDFQIVLGYDAETIAYILNSLGLKVQAGQHFHAGDYVSGIFEDCNIRLDEYQETGRTVLRVIVPDGHNIFPEDERCMEKYKHQILETDLLLRKEECNEKSYKDQYKSM